MLQLASSNQLWPCRCMGPLISRFSSLRSIHSVKAASRFQVLSQEARDAIVRHEDHTLARDDTTKTRHNTGVKHQRTFVSDHLLDAVECVLVLARLQTLHSCLNDIKRCSTINQYSLVLLAPDMSIRALTIIAERAENTGRDTADQTEHGVLAARHVVRISNQTLLLQELRRHALLVLAEEHEAQTLVAGLLKNRGKQALVNAADTFLGQNHLGALPHAGVGADQLGLQCLDLHKQTTYL